MKGKKLTIIGIALSMSLALSTQTSMASELGNKTDLANNVQEQNDKSSKTFSVEKSVQKTLDIVKQPYKNLDPKVGSGTPADATTSATYYRKANWENKIKDKSRWKVEDSQTLVRVTTSDPIQMNDIDYDGMFIDANGRYVIRLVYKEKTQAASAVWHKALINFGDLEKFVDFDLSHVVGRDGTTQYKLENVNGIVGRSFDLPSAVGGRANQRKNLPINLVLKDGIDLNSLGNENFIVQMRITTDDYSKVYAYAPGKSSMDYSTYTKTTGVSLADKVNSLFLKGGLQADSNNATNQEFFMSEFIANPKDYSDASKLGIIRTQYMGQTNTIVRDTVGGEPIAFTQVFDANLVNYLKADSKGNVGYVNVMTVDRKLSPYTKNVGIPKDKINYSADGKLAYIVIGTSDFSKGDVNVVQVPKHDQHTMLSGFYITAIDYVVDKGKFEDTFSSDKVRKLNYSTMSGWTNPNNKGWTVFEKKYANDYVVPEGESYLIDTTSKPAGDQIMIHIGGDQAISRKQQGYYNGFVTGKGAVDTITKFAEGVYKFTLREGATIKAGQSLKIYMPYDSTFAGPVNFLETHNGSKLNEGAATLTLQNDRNINMHLYTGLPRGASFKLKYTLKGETEQKELVFTTPKVGTFWQYKDNDKVLTGLPNTSILSTGGNFWINTKKLEPGKDIIVEAYDNNGNKIDSKTSWFKYVNIDKIENTNKIAWTDHSDKSAILSINKSLYVPYQLLFTNDYADGTDDFYKDPRAFTGTNDDFKKDTKEIVGYTKYDGGKVRTLYEEGRVGKLYAKVEAAANEYDKDGNLVGSDVRKDVTIKKADIFDAQFNEEEKTYKAYEYKVDLTKMLPYLSEDKTETKLELKKDMKFVSTASDGSSLPSDLYETRVRARVLFDTTDGQFADKTKKAVKIVPDNVKFYGEDGYAANGFEGANVEANTGDKFPEVPKLEGKNFLGWVTEEGKKALEGKAVVAADAFAKLSKDQIFTNETPVTKHLVVYAIYSEDVAVTFDANEGKFTDGKDTTTVKAESGSVAKPADPTREGYTFKGWAATKDAKEADANILNNVTAAKTVYAVWEKKADAELTLKNPAKTPVADPNGLTSAEKDAVIAAIIKANPDAGLTAADIKVENDGTATVSKDGKTKEFKPEETVEQKEVQNNFNPPKEPVLVDNTSALTPDEKKAVKKAVKEANPDRNFTDDDITVADDGTVNINQDGKVGTIPAEKTVKAKDSVLKLTDPDVTEVNDTNNLTEEEKGAVKKAVIAKNSGLTENDITVDSKGNVSVKTSAGKTGEIPAAKTVKEKDLSKLKNPAVTPVANDENLTENEKQAVKDAIKAANKDYDLQDNEITVDETGKATVTRGKSSKEFVPAVTVKKDAKLLDVKAPKKTEVANINDLTEPEQEAVEAAIIAANPDLQLTIDDVVINDDGSAVITKDKKVYALSQADNVVESLKDPAITEVADPAALTKYEKEDVERAVREANPHLPEGTTIAVGNDGTVTVTYPKSDGRPAAKIPADKTVKALTDADKNDPAKPATKTEVADKTNLTQKEKDAVKKAIEDANKDKFPQPKDGQEATKVEVGADGTATITYPDGSVDTIPGTDLVKEKAKTQADETTPVVPADKTEVADKTNLTQKEKDAVKKAIEDANKGKFPQPKDGQEATKVEVGADGTATITYPDGSVDTIPGTDLVKEKAKTQADETTPVVPADKTEVADKTNLTQKEKDAVKKAIEDANKGKFPQPKDGQEATKVEVGADGTATITYPDGSVDTIPGTDLVKEKAKTQADETTPVVPADKTEVADKTNLTQKEKDAVKKKVVDANKGKFPQPKDGQEATKVEVGADGTATITYPDGSVDTIPGTDLVKEKAKTQADETTPVVPADKTEVADKTNLTQDEKDAVKKKVVDANKDKFPQPKDGQEATKVEVGADGTATITYPDGSVDTIPGTDLVEEKAKTQADETTPVVPAKTEVADKTNLTQDEKDAVKKKVEDANKDKFPEGTTVTVGDDGTATITYPDKSTDTIKGVDLVEQKSDAGKTDAEKTDPAVPAKTKVGNKGKLTDDEKAAVKKAVEDANKDKFPEGTTVTVGDDGTATITYPDKSTDTIKGSDLTEEKTDAGKTDAEKTDPAVPAKTKVGNKGKLTDDEKAAVKKAVEDANKDKFPKGTTVEVGDDGTATITYPDKSTDTIKGSDLVDQKTDAEKTTADKTDPAVPAKTKVGNKGKLTDDEKATVKKAVEDANKDKFPEGTTVTVGNDGTATITYPDKSTDTIKGSDLVEQKTNAGNESEIKAPAAPVEVKDPSNLTDEEKGKVEDAVKKANPDLPKDAKITVGNDGSVTVTDKDGKEIGKLTPDKTVKKAGAGSQGNVDKSKPSNQKGDKGVNTGDESRTGILATFFASIIALFAIKRRKKDAK